jgi:uncharacterized membrane protein YsdA (DUF1294 family)
MRKTIAFRYGLVLFSIAIITAIILELIFSPGLLYSWLIAINLITFFSFGYDKWASSTSITRIPEKVLLILALTGGTPGALLGMIFFRHKVSKSEFKNKLILVLLVQVVLIAVYYYLL